MAFRDDREALLARIAALETELAQAAGPARKEALDQLHALTRQVAEATAELDEKRHVLAEIGTKLDEVRAAIGGAPAPAPAAATKKSGYWLAAGILAAIVAAAVGLASSIMVEKKEAAAPPAAPPAEPPAERSAPAPPDSPALEPCPDAIAPAGRAPREVLVTHNAFGSSVRVPSCLSARAVPLPETTTHVAGTDFGPNLSAFTSCSLAVTHQPAFAPPGTQRTTWFAIRWRGRFSTNREGHHRFTLASDDGARLLIDGRVVVDGDGLHSWQAAGGDAELAAGDHDIEVQYFQGPDYLGIELSVAPPGCGTSPFELGTTASCPPGARAHARTCTYEDIDPPRGAGPYCDYIADGYFGYSWVLDDASRGHACPTGMERADNGSGGGFCVVRGIEVPPGYRAVAECGELANGRIGYRLEPAP